MQTGPAAGNARGSRRIWQMGVILMVALSAWTGRGLCAAAGENPSGTITQQLLASAGEWNRGNLEGFIAPSAQESTFMTAAGPVGRVHMVERYRTKYFAADRPLQTLRFDELAVRVLGPDHALMTGRFQLTGGGLPDQSGRFTLVWVRTGDSWRILHDHSS